MQNVFCAARAASGLVVAGFLLGGCQSVLTSQSASSSFASRSLAPGVAGSRDSGGQTGLRQFNLRAPVAVKTVSAKPRKSPTPGNKYGRLIEKYARQEGVPIALAHAVVRVESNYRSSARGAAGEVGLMQIKPATARGMGYGGSIKALYDPETNIRWGMKYLGRAHVLGGGSTCGTILKYNAGHGAKRMNKVSSRYCSKVKRILAS